MISVDGRNSILRWLLPLVLAVTVVAVVGGLVARDVYRERPSAPAPIAVPTSSALPLEEQPGSGLVQLTPDAAKHPENETVRSLLQAYFDGINLRNFDRWKTSVTFDRAQAKNEQEWLADYATTKDGSILVYRIETAPDGQLRVLFTFTSTQDVVNAPTDLPEPCIHWRMALPLELENGQWKIGPVPASTKQGKQAC